MDTPKQKVVLIVIRNWYFLLEEYIGTALEFLNAHFDVSCKIVEVDEKYTIDDDTKYLHFQLPNQSTATRNVNSVKNFGIVNIEQHPIIDELLSRNFIAFSYSAHPGNYPITSSIPYIISELECKKISQYIPTNDEYEYDVIIVGYNTPRRIKIIDQLKSLGINACFAFAYGDARDIKIARTKILANVHAHDNFNIHENIRCDRCIGAGILIVSEPSYHPSYFDMDKYMLISEYDSFVNTILDTLKHFDQHKANLNKKLAAPEFSEIIKQRQAMFLGAINALESK